VEEVAWVQDIADISGWPHGIVGYADLLDEAVGETLQRQSKFRLMRGIRMQLHWHDNDMYRFASRPDLMNDALFRRNLRLLADYGWSFDLQVFASQMPDAARLAAENPDITFILQHAGMPEDRAPAGLSLWRDGMKRLADNHNVVSKLSGLGTFIHRNDPAHIGEIIEEMTAIFGTDRCLFGSNFPIEKLWTSYDALVAAFRAALATYSPVEQDAMFRGNAARIYRLG
ncbi:amidohydrolase, partial [Rhizobiaceae sp. 2RAB30]